MFLCVDQLERRAYTCDRQRLEPDGVLHAGPDTGAGAVERGYGLMVIARDGTEIARLSQYGVNLDLDARRPARWTEEIRGRAAALVVPVSC